MSVPTTRTEFLEHCLRRLGWPVIEINGSDEQFDDRVDEALRYFWDFHFEGSEKVYFKYQVTANNYSTKVYDVTITNGGTLYSNTDVLSFVGGGGAAANGTITTNANGTITAVTFDNGSDYANPPSVAIVTSTGSGASLTADLGGFIPVPDSIIGVVGIFNIGMSDANINSIFNIRYQIALNDLYMMNNLYLPDYTIVRHNLALIEEILVGKQPIRFNRYRDRLYIDMDWNISAPGTWIILDAYGVISPDDFPEVWSDPFLQRYATALMKRQFGANLKKFGQMPMVGGLIFNGQTIYDEAIQEIAELRQEMMETWSIPALGLMVG